MSVPPRVVNLSSRATALLYGVAFVIAVLFVALVGLDRGTKVFAVRPGATPFGDTILPIFVVVFVVGALSAIRWPLAGGALAAVSTAALAPFAMGRLQPWSAFIVVATPAVAALLWVVVGVVKQVEPDQPDVTRRRMVLAAVGGIAFAAVMTGALGRLVYRRIWGPTHPESALTPLPGSALRWVWCGAVTHSECAVRALPRQPFGTARLHVATNPELTDAGIVPLTDVFDRVVDFRVSGLRPNTRYFYGVELDGEIDQVRTGSLRTFPDERAPVRIVFASCARIGSNGAVFDAIRRQDPIVYVCLGDFHYGDNFVDDVDSYRRVFDVQLSQPAQAELYRSIPIAYVWDDHDYGPDDSDKDAVARNAAMIAYREYVPHYNVAGPTSAIYQAFSVGRVRIVLTDARSSRDPQTLTDTIDKSMLGTAQRAWLLDELRARSADHDLVIWVNPVPWVDERRDGADSWAGYAAERSLIADHIADHGVQNLLMVSGDAHMVAIDDGTNTNYSATAGTSFPLLHVAALDRPGSTKGGPYTHGPIAGGGQFAVVDATFGPDGRTVNIDLDAMNWRGERILHYRFSLTTAQP